MTANFKSLNKFEQGALIAGGLSILLSFFGSYVRASYSGGGGIGGISTGVSAWSSYATIGMLLVVAATAVIAIRSFSPSTLPEGVPWNLVALAASALGTVLIVLRALTVGGGGFGVSVGPGWSGWALFVTTIALTACTAMLFKASGEKLPELNTTSDAD